MIKQEKAVTFNFTKQAQIELILAAPRLYIDNFLPVETAEQRQAIINGIQGGMRAEISYKPTGEQGYVLVKFNNFEGQYESL